MRQRLRKLGQFLNIGDVAQIAGQDRREIGSQPVLPPSLIFAADRLRKSSEQDELDQIVADDRVPLALELSFEEALEEGRRLVGHRMNAWLASMVAELKAETVTFKNYPPKEIGLEQ